jgi:tetratricopeptide (TPR) repeat protein
MAGRTKSRTPDPRTKEERLDEAQDLIYDAWEAADRRTALALARKALRISPDCADAYVLLAQTARTRAQEFELYRKGVEAGERALGKEAFKRDVGHFWGILETRPYMRARAGLAECLWDQGHYDEAIAHWRDMLRLNPGDNQGMRYTLAARLLYLDRDEETAAVLAQYKGECSTYFLWTEAILLFRSLGDHPRCRRALDAALLTNPHVPTFLFGQKRIPREIPDYVTWGGEDEAAECVYELIRPWKTTKGAIEWLGARISTGRPALLN